MTHDAHLAVDLLGFLTLGLLGSVGHCAGMCAPFVMVVSRQYTPPSGPHSPLIAQLWYSAGRIVTYTLLGAAAGAFGFAIDRAGALMGVQRIAIAIAGSALVIWTVSRWVGYGDNETGALFTRAARVVRGRIPPHPLLIGLFLGLLPCGFLYAALIAAIGRGSAIGGAEAMATFGIGTVPALLGVSIADRMLGRRLPFASVVSQAFVFVMGVWYLFRGIAA